MRSELNSYFVFENRNVRFFMCVMLIIINNILIKYNHAPNPKIFFFVRESGHTGVHFFI